MKFFHGYAKVSGHERLLRHFGFNVLENHTVWLLDIYHWSLGRVITTQEFYDKYYDSLVNIADAIAIHSSTLPASAPITTTAT